jgi:hypothetical protein
MDIQVIILYSLTDDMLHGLGHSEPPRRSMSDARGYRYGAGRDAAFRR